MVNDLEKSLAFYSGMLGLPVDSRHSGPGMEMAMLGEANQPKIELISNPDSRGRDLHSDISVGVTVESMESALKLLEEHQIPVLRGPISPAPNLQFVFVNDPDGYTVQLVEMFGS